MGNALPPVRDEGVSRLRRALSGLLESQARQFAQALIDAADYIAELEAQR
jgi:hypothetical protein